MSNAAAATVFLRELDRKHSSVEKALGSMSKNRLGPKELAP